MAKKTKPKPTESFCIKHGRILPITEFHKSPNPFHENEVLPYCKKCAHEMVKFYIQKYKTMQAAIYYTCSMMGIPFIYEVYEIYEEKIQNIKQVNNYWGNYMQIFLTMQNKAQEEKWVDFGASDIDLKDIKDIQKSELAIERELKELEYKWGKGYNTEQYQFLEQRYSEWTQDKRISDYENTQYHNLCRAELIIYENEEDTVTEALKIQKDCAKELKLNQFELAREKSLGEKTLESRIDVMENNEPSEYFRNQKLYRDFRGIRAGWILELLRPFRNILTGSKDYNVDGEDMLNFDEKVNHILEEESNEE